MRSPMKLMAALALACIAGWPTQADAKPKITEKTEYYQISGKTGVDLLWDMNRKGPRQGFLTKAIAQTRFETDFQGDMDFQNGVCRVSGGGVVMKITYIYPQPREKLSGDMVRRWKLFQADNVRHEKVHGRIAREMASVLDEKIRSFATKGDRRCSNAMAKLKRETKAIYDAYEKKQNDFDRQEHREGGAVDRSVAVLVGKR